jgi:mRNA interferase MazF
MTLQFGEVVLINVLFHQATGAKVRPALVLLDTGDEDFLAAPVTSRARGTEYDVALKDWQASVLNIASYVRVHKLTVLAKAEVIRRLGTTSAADRDSLHQVLCHAFCRKAV